MNAPTIDIAVHIILNDTGDAAAKVADAELHFAGGPLSGLKLIGFAVWESHAGSVRHVTFPSRQYRVHGELRAFALLRPIDDDRAAHELRALILAACRTAEGTATAEQLVRDTLLPTHRLTREQVIELIEDITVVMGVEQLNPRGAWRLIVARLGGIHNLSAHLALLTNRHRAKRADAARNTPRTFAARLVVGPCFVRRIANHMREAGINVTVEGTEHIHFTIDSLSSDAVPKNIHAALCKRFPPSAEGYSWEWVTDCVSDVRPIDATTAAHHPLRVTSADQDRPH